MIAELNGEPIEANKLSSLALCNYGHFTSLVVKDGAARGLGLHLDRLQRDCQAIHSCELDRDEARRLIRQAADQTDDTSVLRVTIFDPALDLGHPGDDLRPQILVTSRPAPATTPGPIALAATEYIRDLPEVKHVGLFATVALRRAVQLDGFDDVVFHDDRGRLSEGATWNCGFIGSDGTVMLPDQPCLPGVTLRLLREALDREGLVWCERTITVADAVTMPAGFITNAAVGIRPMAAFNGAVLNPDHPRIRDLRKLYDGIESERV